jgi:hypothetical protein
LRLGRRHSERSEESASLVFEGCEIPRRGSSE